MPINRIYYQQVRCKDKFLVSSLPATAEFFHSVDRVDFPTGEVWEVQLQIQPTFMGGREGIYHYSLSYESGGVMAKYFKDHSITDKDSILKMRDYLEVAIALGDIVVGPVIKTE
jgi:hypothetical protein